jgi:hypothetical protein
MALIIIIVCALVLAAVTVVIGVAFGYQKNATLKTVFSFAMGAAIVLGAFSLILGSIFNNKVTALKETYSDLTLYQPLVKETDNEYIRYNFFNEVNEYNEMYDEVAEIAANGWYGGLVPKHWNIDIDTIDFRLNGVQYRGGH